MSSREIQGDPESDEVVNLVQYVRKAFKLRSLSPPGELPRAGRVISRSGTLLSLFCFRFDKQQLFPREPRCKTSPISTSPVSYSFSSSGQIVLTKALLRSGPISRRITSSIFDLRLGRRPLCRKQARLLLSACDSACPVTDPSADRHLLGWAPAGLKPWYSNNPKRCLCSMLK